LVKFVKINLSGAYHLEKERHLCTNGANYCACPQTLTMFDVLCPCIGMEYNALVEYIIVWGNICYFVALLPASSNTKNNV